MAKERRMFMFYNSSKHGERNFKRIYTDGDVEVWFCSNTEKRRSKDEEKPSRYTVNFLNAKDDDKRTAKDLTPKQNEMIQKAINDFEERKNGHLRKTEFKKDLRELLKEKGIPTHDENGQKLGLRRRIAMLEQE